MSILHRRKRVVQVAPEEKPVLIPEWGDLVSMDIEEINALASMLGIETAQHRMAVLSQINKARPDEPDDN